MNPENTQNQRKCIKIDTMYNGYEVNFNQIHIKWRKRNWKSPVNVPSLNLKWKMAAKIRRVHFWRFVAVYLWKSITCIYCMYLPFTYEANLTVLKEKEKNTRKHTATKRMKEHGVSGMTQDDFVKVIWQTKTGSETNLLCWCHSDSEYLDDVSSSSHDFFWRCLSTLDYFPNSKQRHDLRSHALTNRSAHQLEILQMLELWWRRKPKALSSSCFCTVNDIVLLYTYFNHFWIPL